VIARLDELLAGAQEYFRAKIDDVFDGAVDPGTVDIAYRLYGRDAVLGDRETHTGQPTNSAS